MRRATIIIVIGSVVFSLFQMDWAEARNSRRRRYVECIQPCDVRAPFPTINCPTQYVSTSTDSMGNKWDTWECNHCISRNGMCSASGTGSESYEETTPGTLVAVKTGDCTKDCSCPMGVLPTCTDADCRIYGATRVSADCGFKPPDTSKHLGAKGLKIASAKLDHKVHGKYTFRQMQVIFVKTVKGKNVLRYADMLIATETNANPPRPPIAYGFEIAGDVPDGFVGLKTTRPDANVYPYVYWVDFEDVSGADVTGSIIAVHD